LQTHSKISGIITEYRAVLATAELLHGCFVLLQQQLVMATWQTSYTGNWRLFVLVSSLFFLFLVTSARLNLMELISSWMEDLRQ